MTLSVPSWWRSWWRWATSPTRRGRWRWPSRGWTVCCRSSSTRWSARRTRQETAAWSEYEHVSTTLHTSVSLSFLFCWQSDTEKLKGLPVAPFMDRDKVSKPSSQTNFIRFVLLPLFSELTKLFPCLEVKFSHFSKSDAEQRFKGLKFCCHVVVQQHILEPVRRALEYYSDMERAAKEEEETRKTWGGRRAADSDQSASWHWNIGSLKCV